MKALLNSFALAGALLATAPFASAQVYTGIQDAIPVAVDLGGSVKYDGWYNLSASQKTKTVHGTSHTFAGNTGYPQVFTSTNPWPAAIQSQLYSGSRASLNKTANGNGFGPYPAGDSIYAISFGNTFNARGGTFGITETSPVAGLQTVVFQVEIGAGNGYDFWESDVPSDAATPYGSAGGRAIGLLSDFAAWAPTLTLNFAGGSPVTIVADYAALLDKGFNGTASMPTGPGGTYVDEDIWINLYGFQWDLSAYTDVTSYSIGFSVVEHSQFYAAQLDQGSVFSGEVLSGLAAVPEPSSFAALAGLGAIGFAALRRRRA